MYNHIEGTITHKTPAFVVLDTNGIGYQINISLNTYEKIQRFDRCRLLTHFIVKEDGHSLYGFHDENERGLFRHLISISGVGPNTARTLLSYLSPNELRHAIIKGDVTFLKSVKGIGPKSAQRIIIELQDVLQKEPMGDNIEISSFNKQNNEAVSALVMLGFVKSAAEKAILKIQADNKSEELTVEQLIKKALQLI